MENPDAVYKYIPPCKTILPIKLDQVDINSSSKYAT